MAGANGGVIINQKGCAALLGPSRNVDFQGGGAEWFLITGFVFSCMKMCCRSGKFGPSASLCSRFPDSGGGWGGGVGMSYTPFLPVEHILFPGPGGV